ncbi:MAG: radical SAM protein, partial [Bacteroidaceae bacterium]|nr:radical SAM protein [Bacteroidaceae bacterium]
MSGIYIHVPFCQSRCIYCDFYSTTCDRAWQERYVSAAIREMQRRRHELDPSDLRTIYLGGGTPSQLRPTLLLQLFEALSQLFPLDRLTEVTIEANPDDVTPQWLDAVRQTPVNRISMGVQTFDDAMLRFLRRRHTAEQAVQAVELCRRYGYENLSLDLIYGLPGQTLP